MPIRQLDRAEIRREARELIRTARVSPIKFTLLFLAVSLALSLLDTALTSLTGRIVGVAFVSVSFASILIGLITQVLDAGYKCYCLGVHRREEMPYESLFDGFTFAGKVIALYIVEGFFVALWSMLFVIPGIIAVYRYSFAIWNLCQNPELGVMEALNRSKRQTIGYKGQLFGLHLSFIGWYLIVFVIVGVYEGVILALMPDSFLGIMLGSLILTVLTVIGSILLLIGCFKKKEQAETDENGNVVLDANGEEKLEYTRKNKNFWRISSLIPAIGAVVAFILTENMRNPMIWVDKWTILMVVIALVQVVVAILSKSKKEEPEEEEAVQA